MRNVLLAVSAFLLLASCGTGQSRWTHPVKPQSEVKQAILECRRGITGGSGVEVKKELSSCMKAKGWIEPGESGSRARK